MIQILLLLVLLVPAAWAENPTLSYQTLMKDIIINSDLWASSPMIMSAGYGFQGIIGVGPLGPLNPAQQDVIAAGGSWEVIKTPNAPAIAYTTSASPSGVAVAYGYPVYNASAIPVCFSWPVLPSTVDPSSFSITLNTGKIVNPLVVSISPNLEYNERTCVVVFGDFGNRLKPGVKGSVYPTSVTIAKGKTILKLVGPNGPVNAVGLSIKSSNPYVKNGGPTLNAAKISVLNIAGEGAPLLFAGNEPNDCLSYYGKNGTYSQTMSDGGYRLRIFTTGGFSPDGCAAILPTDFATFFKIQVTDREGKVSYITKAGRTYEFSKGKITVIGLADLGTNTLPLNDAYVTDRDNYIDFCMIGDKDAMKLITAVKIPASDGYKPLYNPGGPGNNPTKGVTYTQPGKEQLISVIQAIDNPMTVTYIGL